MNSRIFLNYAREDCVHVEAIYSFLSENGFHPWMDVRDLIGGEQWEFAIKRAIRCSRLFLACISEHSINKQGIIEEERRDALEILQNLPETNIFLIPLRLAALELPESLNKFQWVDWFQPDGRDRLLAAVKEAFNRQVVGIQPLPVQSLTAELAHNIPLPALAIDVKFVHRGGANELLHLQSEKNFDIRTNEAKLRAINDVERLLPQDRSRINAFFCLLGDHLIGRYDFFLVEELLNLAAKHGWCENRYIILNKRIGGLVDHDYDSLFLWFGGVRSGGAADILEVRYEARCPDAIQLSNAMNRSIVRYQKIQGLTLGEKWRCLLSNNSRKIEKFLNDFLAPKDYWGNLVIIVDSGNPASQTRFVNSALDKYPGRNVLIITIDVEPSLQLISLCRDRNLRMIECRGPFELRYFLLQLNASSQQT